MPRTRQPRTAALPLTTAQALGSLVKSARDIMRKDEGLSGDGNRTPTSAIAGE
jgi:type I restriction enzyme M protein